MHLQKGSIKASVKNRHRLVQNHSISFGPIPARRVTENAADDVKCRNAQRKYFQRLSQTPQQPMGSALRSNCELCEAQESTRVHQQSLSIICISLSATMVQKGAKDDRLACVREKKKKRRDKWRRRSRGAKRVSQPARALIHFSSAASSSFRYRCCQQHHHHHRRRLLL